MPRKREPGSPEVVYRTARCGLRLTPAQKDRVFGLLRSAGDVWCCVVDMNRWRRKSGHDQVVGYQELCRALAGNTGQGTFGELSSDGARSVLRRYSDAWFAAAKARAQGDKNARFPRRRRYLVPVRFYHGGFTLDGRSLQVQVARGCPPLVLGLDRDVPYPAAGAVRSVTIGYDRRGKRLYADVTAEVPVARPGPDPARVAGVDPGIIHPFAVAGPGGTGLLVSGRAVRAEHRLHLKDTKARQRAVAARKPARGQAGSRRWKKFRQRQNKAEARHRRRVAQARHEAAREVVTFAVEANVGTLVVGDPRGVLEQDAGRVHNKRTRDWGVGQALRVLADKAQVAGIAVVLVDERGTSSTCPACGKRVPKPSGRNFTCPHCMFTAHRDLCGAALIAARGPGGGVVPPVPDGTGLKHRRVGRHLPGAGPGRRDPRRAPSRPRRGHLAGSSPPRTPPVTGGARGVARGHREELANSPAPLQGNCE